MPTVRTERGYRFFFYSDEGSPREPRHVHVARGAGTAKAWLDPEPVLDRTVGLSARELRQAMRIIMDHAEEFRRAWDEHFRS